MNKTNLDEIVGHVLAVLVTVVLTVILLVYVWLNAHWSVALAISLERFACVIRGLKAS
jgi:hypothetical protein